MIEKWKLMVNNDYNVYNEENEVLQRNLSKCDSIEKAEQINNEKNVRIIAMVSTVRERLSAESYFRVFHVVDFEYDTNDACMDFHSFHWKNCFFNAFFNAPKNTFPLVFIDQHLSNFLKLPENVIFW